MSPTKMDMKEFLKKVADEGLTSNNVEAYLQMLVASAYHTKYEVEKVILQFPEESKDYFRKNDSLPAIVSVSPDEKATLEATIEKVELGQAVPLSTARVNSNNIETFAAIKEVIQLIKCAQSTDAEFINSLIECIDGSSETIIQMARDIDDLSNSNIDNWSELVVDFLMLGYKQKFVEDPPKDTILVRNYGVIVNAANSDIGSAITKRLQRHKEKHKRVIELTGNADLLKFKFLDKSFDASKAFETEKEHEARDRRALLADYTFRDLVRSGINVYVKKSLKRWVK